MPKHAPVAEAETAEISGATAQGAPPAPTPSPVIAPASAVLTLAEARRVQTEVMDFADDMTVRLAEAMDQIEVLPLSMDARVAAHRLKYTIAHGATLIASAQNPRIALVDMLVMITLQRALIERDMTAGFFGTETGRLRTMFEQSERQIRTLAERSLTPEQLAEIDRLIAAWLEENPGRRYAAYVRFSEFAAARQTTTVGAQSGRPSNVLGFLFIDPLSGLDPTTREIEQARLFAERALFSLQRMPLLLSWQAELLYIDAAGEPEVRDVLANLGRATASAEKLTAEVEAFRRDLPTLVADERAAALEQASGIIATEREAAIAQALVGLRAEREATLEQLASEQARLSATLTELRGAVEAGTTLSGSLRETAGALSDLAGRLGLDEPRDPDSEPFRIQDWTEAIRETTRAAEELRELTLSLTGATDPEVLGQRLALIDQRLIAAESSAERVLDRAFHRALTLVIVLIIGLALVVVLAWVLRRGRPVV